MTEDRNERMNVYRYEHTSDQVFWVEALHLEEARELLLDYMKTTRFSDNPDDEYFDVREFDLFDAFRSAVRLYERTVGKKFHPDDYKKMEEEKNGSG